MKIYLLSGMVICCAYGDTVLICEKRMCLGGS